MTGNNSLDIHLFEAGDPSLQNNCWAIVTSLENFTTTESFGFTVQGVKSRHRKKASTITSGDRVIYYITGLKVLAGIVRVTSPQCFEDDQVMWRCKSNPKEEVYPIRFHITPEWLLHPADYRPAETIVHKLTYFKKWPAKHWHLGFQGNLHHWTWDDYETVRTELTRYPSRF